jgi:PAS domain S-box-containing protein
MDFDAEPNTGLVPHSLVRELADNEARYRALFGHNPDPIFVLDDDAMVVSANTALEAITGYALNDLLLRPFTDLLVETDREHALRHVRRALAGTAQVLEVVGVNRDGREFTISLSVFPLRDGRTIGVYGIARDITAQKEAERALRDSEERYRMLADHVQDMVSLHDLDGRFLYATPSAMKILGVHPVELIGRSVFEMVVPDDVAALQAAHRDVLVRNGQGPLAYRAYRADGSVGWFETTARMTDPDASGERRLVGVTRDITERRQLEQRLTQSEKLEAIGRLAGGIAHDFNNLLTVISGQAQMALSNLADETQVAEELDGITAAADRATALTAQLLAFGRRQMSKPAVLDLNESILGLHPMLRRLVSEDVVIETEMAPDLWPIQLDPVQLEQIVVNLVVNARDAMHGAGTVRITTANLPAADTLAEGVGLRRADYVVLRVADTGPGMDSEAARHAFEPFFNVNPDVRGSGLGLPTVYGIVEQAEGAVHLQSAPGAGTILTVYLRRTEVPVPTFAATRAAAAERLHGTECVLVVEDDPGVRSLTEAVLGRYGYTVVSAGGGLEAIDLFDSLEHVDLVVSDVIMPHMQGPELAEKLRLRSPALPVLFMSGYTSDALARRGLAGSVELLNKPFRPEALAAYVRRILDRAPAAQ